ncbi:MAG: hypothetical protein OEW15_14090 [Nitrospirota bacterium]|nr:hypothetical protein [Nitrospirota bacterium]
MRELTKSGTLMLIAAVTLLLFTYSSAEAGLVFSFDVQESYNDNVIGLVQDNPNTGGTSGGGGMGGMAGGMSILQAQQGGLNDNPGGTGTSTGTGTGTTSSQTEQQGDFSTSLSADIGSKISWGEKTDILVLGAVSHTSFATYDEFDFTVGSLSAGITRRFTELLSGRCSLKAAAKDFKSDLRDSTAFGASAGLKETVSDSIWFKQTYEFERNRADSPLYSYYGHSGTAWIGFSPSENTSLDLGYGYLSRTYDLPVDFTVTTQTVSVFFGVDLSDSWSFSLGYDHEMADSNVPDTATTNNVYSVGLRYDY